MSKYDAEIDPASTNTSHSLMLQLVGRDKRVLELGCAGGHMTRALVAQGCTVVGVELDADAARDAAGAAERVLVADLQSPDLLARIGDDSFDAVVMGDVLEHLPDPVVVLRSLRQVLRPGGFVVVSVPNIAHGDVRLALLQGEFRYRPLGLLDATHLRFFTTASVAQLVADGGYDVVESRRTYIPLFGTEIEVDAASLPPGIAEYVRAQRDSDTYQFVVKAVPSPRRDETAAHQDLADTAGALAPAEPRAAVKATRAFADDVLAENRALRLRVTQMTEHAEAATNRAVLAERELGALRATKLFRVAAPLRRAYGRVRRRLRAQV